MQISNIEYLMSKQFQILNFKFSAVARFDIADLGLFRYSTLGIRYSAQEFKV